MLKTSLVPYRVIKEYRPAKYLVENHEHPYFHMIYVSTGKLLVFCRDAKVEADAGTVVLIPPHSGHMIYAVDATHSIELKFSCEGDLAPLSRTFETKSHWVWQPDSSAGACLLSIMTEAENKKPHYIEIISVRISDLLLQLLRSLEDRSPLLTSETSLSLSALPELSAEADTMAEAIRYIDAHLLEAPSISDVAEHLGYSKAYFSTIFKKEVGATPQQFIAYRKINLAKSLIRKGQMSFSAISDALNFSSVSAFTNTFKRCCGITPSHYAQSIRQCTYINLVESPDLPLDDVRYIEPVFQDNIQNLLHPPASAD